MQACSGRVLAGVEVVQLHVLHICLELISVIRLIHLETTCHPCKYPQCIVHGVGHVGCMYVCPCFSHLKVTADLNYCINVYWLSPVGLKPSSSGGLGGHSPMQQRRTGSISQRMSQALRCPPCSMTPCGMRMPCGRVTD